MYTAMALVALTMGNLTTSPTWLDDYRAAQAQVTVAGKPMAVFVGAGKDGVASAIRDGFDPAVSKLLAEKFVCLYVDSSTPAGKKVAAAFQVGDRGVVLSDRTGRTQAYSASGTISRAELSRALIAYGDVEVAQKTDTPKTTTSGATSGPSAGTTTGTTSGGAVMAAPGTMPGGVMVGPGPGMMMGQPYMGQPYMGQPYMAQPGYMGGPVMAQPGMMGGGYGYGGGGCGQGGYGGGCGQSSGCGMGGHGGGHGCCFLGGFMSKCGFGGGGGYGQSAGCGTSHGCGMGGGHGCGGLFGGFGGGMGHGCGGFGGGFGGGCGGGGGHGGCCK
jgi:hypothetical protein